MGKGTNLRDSSLGLLVILCRWSGSVVRADTEAERCFVPMDPMPLDDETDEPDNIFIYPARLQRKLHDFS